MTLYRASNKKYIGHLQNHSRFIALALAGLLFFAAASVYADNPAAEATPTDFLAAQQDTVPPTNTLPTAESVTTISAPQGGKNVGQGAKRISGSSHLASVALGLFFIVALILILGWFLRRFNQGGIFSNSSIKIIATLPMGTRERLAVVDVGGQQLLLGITATNINTLHVFSEPVIDPVADTPAASDFGKKLMAILQQKNIKDSSETKEKSAT